MSSGLKIHQQLPGLQHRGEPTANVRRREAFTGVLFELSLEGWLTDFWLLELVRGVEWAMAEHWNWRPGVKVAGKGAQVWGESTGKGGVTER